MKRLFSALLCGIISLLMVVGSGITAYAADATVNGTEATYQSGKGGSASITITLPTTGEGQNTSNKYNYKIYKVFDATVGDESATNKNDANIAYTVPSGRSVDANSGMTTYFTVSGGGNVSAKDAAKDTSGNLTSGAVDAIKKYLGLGTCSGNASTPASAVVDVDVPFYNSSNQAITKLTISELEYGYYYITTTTGSVVSVTSTTPNATTQDKNTVPSLTKKITNVDDGSNPINFDITVSDWEEGETIDVPFFAKPNRAPSSSANTRGSVDNAGKNAIAELGSTVHFESTITIGKGAMAYIFKDKMSDGLKLNIGTDDNSYIGVYKRSGATDTPVRGTYTDKNNNTSHNWDLDSKR